MCEPCSGNEKGTQIILCGLPVRPGQVRSRATVMNAATKPLLIILLAVACVACRSHAVVPDTVDSGASVQEDASTKGGDFPELVQDQLIVRFVDGLDEDAVTDVGTREGGQVLRYWDRLGLYLVGLPEGSDVRMAADRWSALPEVDYAEPNFRHRIRPTDDS